MMVMIVIDRGSRARMGDLSELCEASQAHLP